MKKIVLSNFMLLIMLFWGISLEAQVQPVGNGSYATAFPGKDGGNRNGFPAGTPNIGGNALGKPVPTNDWWSNLLTSDANVGGYFGGNLFNYPLSFHSRDAGLSINYTWPNVTGSHTDFREPKSAVDGILIGVVGVAERSKVIDYSDWTVTMGWGDANQGFKTTIGLGMPFVYFEKAASSVASVTIDFNLEGVTIVAEKLHIQNNFGGANYVVYAPKGSTWTKNGNTYTSTLNGKNYWSMVLVPDGQDINTITTAYEQYAYVFPGNTEVTWDYNETTSSLKSTYTITPVVKEGTGNFVLQGILPHHWNNLAANSPTPNGHNYKTVRGEMRTMGTDHFIVENTFSGILPNLPDLGRYSNRFSMSELNAKIDAIKGEGLDEWTDSYNEGQAFNRLIQAARIAEQLGNEEAKLQILNTVKDRLENWLTYTPGEVSFMFYYHEPWSALLGFPAGHLQDTNLNDHHFHWGYYIRAAAAMEQYFPGWADEYGEMINLLVRDAASFDRNDEMFPFLRSFSPFSGHCWANGLANAAPHGNDQESSSESMQFNSALIHWGAITGNTEIRDLGIYLYTTEQTAIEEYWFDIHERNFQPGYQYEMVARVWGSGYDNGTFWTEDVAAAYGIELYPIHGGSLYLGHHPEYVQRVWNGMTQNTGILNNVQNPNLWHDVYWKYLSFIDAGQALDLYYDFPQRNLKFGISDAHTYHWLHNMHSLGQVRNDITADHPIAAAFEKNGSMTYVAHNYTNQPITVNYSTGYSLAVPARSMVTNRDSDVNVDLSVSENEVATGASVTLTAQVEGEGVSQVEFFQNDVSIGTDNSAPYEITVNNLEAGLLNFYAKAVTGTEFANSNVVSVQVGSQVPYGGTPWPIPGQIESGKFDVFEGGRGQGISYFDTTPFNQGSFRADEYVDAVIATGEGATVGWIASGEWLEYSVMVGQAGTYKMSFRYASQLATGGPFHISVNGQKVSPDIQVTGTGSWETWATQTVDNIQLAEGAQIIRVAFDGAGFNLGRMTFEYVGEYDGNIPPVAEAGANQTIQLPNNSITLNGSASNDPDGSIVGYEWQKVSGPAAVISNSSAVQTTVTGLVEGSYTFRLTVTDNDGASASDEVAITVQAEDGDGGDGGVCYGADPDGYFSWTLSYDNGQAQMTFLPEQSGVGSTTLIFHYKTNPADGFPGYIITPGTPYTFNVDESATVYFYFTYNVPEGGERNSLATNASATLSDCNIVTQMNTQAVKETKVDVFPNPVSDKLFVKVEGDSTFDFVKIMDMNGRELLKKTCDSNNLITIEIGHLQKGLYFVMLENGDEVIVRKVVKE